MRQHFHTLVIAAAATALGALGACEPAPSTTAEGEPREAPRPVATAAAPEDDAVRVADVGAADDPYVLVVLGDSLSAGYGIPLDAALPAQVQRRLDAAGVDAEVRNAGVSGDTSAQALARFDWSVGEDADGVVVELGANDMLQGAPPDVLATNLAAIIERARARGLWVGLVGMRAPYNLDADYRRSFEDLYFELADARGVALYPYYYEGLIDAATGVSRPELFLPDGLHPTDAGVAVVAEGVADWLLDEAPELARQARAAH